MEETRRRYINPFRQAAVVSTNGPQPGGLQSRWIARPFSALSPEGTVTPWVWHGYLARGSFTSFTGLPKIGKTTFLSYFLKELDGRDKLFCGHLLLPGPALVISEESEVLWARRRDGLGIGDQMQIITRPFLGRPDSMQWDQFIKCLADQVRAGRHGLVVFDALPNLWAVRDENDAADVRSALTPLYALTEAGAAVLLIMHPTKTDAGEGRATRGSSAIGGFVDVIVEMRRYDPARHQDTRRELKTYSRFDETPGAVVLEFAKSTGYRVVGTKSDARAEDRMALIRELLPHTPPGARPKELLTRWPVEGPVKPGEKTLRRDLDKAVKTGMVQRTGRGTNRAPYRYYQPSGANPESNPDSPPHYTPHLSGFDSKSP